MNQRFPAAFTDSETALKESKRCAGLVERALKAFADRAASTTDKKVRKKPVLVVDRIFQKSADEVTRSGEPKLETIYRRSKVDAASGRRK